MKRYFSALAYLAGVHLTGLLFLTVFRLLLYIQGAHYIDVQYQNFLTQAPSFVRGVWFDNVVACYIMLLPLAVVSFAALFGCFKIVLYRAVHLWFIVFYALLFLISAADIPYFDYFFKHLNSSVFGWMSYGSTTFGMMFTESSYYLPMSLFLLSLILFIYLSGRLFGWMKARFLTSAPVSANRYSGVVYFCCSSLLIGLCLFGMRGRMGYNPIRVSAAFYCNDPFLNQLGINPAFNLLRSTLESEKKENRDVELKNDTEAVILTQQYLGIPDTLQKFMPLARPVVSKAGASKRNVVLILMESMSADFLARYGNTGGLTPFLDSLSRHAICFDQIYSAGIHTNHGILATLYSYPALMKRNLMKGAVIQNYVGLPSVLRRNGYETIFFMTHESQYDNMNGFLRTNGFNQVYSEENYPPEEVVNSFGVQDDFLFDFALPVMGKTARETPFFATLLTISNHPPYVIPDWFEPKSTKVEDQIVEYADCSLNRFFTKAKQEPWFDNTLFVFVADHGKLVGDVDCEMPQSYNHVPLFIYDPKADSARVVEKLGGQIDIMPTVLGLLGLKYTNAGFGIDLMKETRPCIFFTADDAIGCKSDSLFYVFKPDENQEFLYSVEEGVVGEQIPVNGLGKDFIKSYAFSMLQAAQLFVKEGKTWDRLEDPSRR